MKARKRILRKCKNVGTYHNFWAPFLIPFFSFFISSPSCHSLKFLAPSKKMRQSTKKRKLKDL